MSHDHTLSPSARVLVSSCSRELKPALCDAGADSSQQVGHDVVLLYNRNDRDTVASVYRELKSRGLNPWMDSEDHRPGEDWRMAVQRAVQNATTAVVFVGASGAGPWQSEELPLLHKTHLDRGIDVIPALFHDGKLPDDMLFQTRSSVNCRARMPDSEFLDELEFAISGIDPQKRRGRYGILAEVAESEPHCFVATSHTTSAEIYEAMVRAVRSIDLLVKQPRQFSCDPHNVYSPDVVMAIRSARVILADGTIDPATGKPDADVMYEVGLATALAKPVVYVTSPRMSPLPLPIVAWKENWLAVEYDANELDAEGPLQEQLAARLRTAMGVVRHPYLITEDSLQISVASSDMFHLRPMFWPQFEQVMRFGLVTKARFAEILKHVHKLQQLIEVAFADVTNVRNGTDSQHAIIRFLDVYRQFCGPHQKSVDQVFANDEVKSESAIAFSSLLKHTECMSDGESEVSEIIRRAHRFFQILDSYLIAYMNANETVQNRVQNLESLTLRQVIQLHADIQQLVCTAELVPVHACEMMFELLKLIGMRDAHGGK